MATLREIICSEGVDTLREYMCVETGEGGGDTYITDGIISVIQEEGISVATEEETISVVEEPGIEVVAVEEPIKVTITEEDTANAVC